MYKKTKNLLNKLFVENSKFFFLILKQFVESVIENRKIMGDLLKKSKEKHFLNEGQNWR